MTEQRTALRAALRRGTMMALAAFATVGCGAPGVDDGAETPAGDEATVTTEDALHTFPGIPALSWRGAPPTNTQRNTNQPGLQVVYSLQPGVTNKTVVGLQVCWYTPSNADNRYRAGDPTGCTILGAATASKWTMHTCPAGQVVSGYTTKANGANTKIVKFGTSCTSLTNQSVFTIFPDVGDPDILFSDILACKGPNGTPAYMEYFSANANFSGFNGVCVLK